LKFVRDSMSNAIGTVVGTAILALIGLLYASVGVWIAVIVLLIALWSAFGYIVYRHHKYSLSDDSGGHTLHTTSQGSSLNHSDNNHPIAEEEQSMEFYPCFISYAHQNEEFAQKLHADLRSKGVQCWYAPEDLKIGDKIRSTIDQSIQSNDKLLLILSAHSIDSDWVEKEVEIAFEKERKHKQSVLFPIRLDAAVMDTDQAWAADIRRTRYIGDFTRWRDGDAYQRSFQRLLRDLQATHN
jgi:hypothetical protein